MASLTQYSASGSGAIRVLVVDDDGILVRALQRVLGLQGFEVDTALDGRAALNRLENGEYDVMLLDLRMGSMDGMEVYAVAQRNSPPATIIHSAHIDVRTAVMATRAGSAELNSLDERSLWEQSVLAKSTQQAAPPERHVADENARRFTMTHRVIRAESSKAAMLNRDQGTARARFEADFDLGAFVGREVHRAPFEDQQAWWLPARDATGFGHSFADVGFERLEQATAELRLEAQNAALAADSVFQPAPPPEIDLFREHAKRFFGRQLHQDRGGGPVTGGGRRAAHRGPGLRRSAWALNAESCSLQNASTSASQ